MSDTLPITEARAQFGSLVRRAHGGERITVTDHGEPAAVLVSPAELAELELERDALMSWSQYEARKAAGTLDLVPHEEVKRRLGLE